VFRFVDRRNQISLTEAERRDTRVYEMVDEFNDAEIVKTYKKTSKDVETASNISIIEKCSVSHKFLVPSSKESVFLKMF